MYVCVRGGEGRALSTNESLRGLQMELIQEGQVFKKIQAHNLEWRNYEEVIICV